MIIGITGPAGSGKDTSAHHIAEHLSIPHVSGGDILREMLTKAGLEPKKSVLGSFGVFLRASYGPDAVARRSLDKASDKGVIYSGFRSVAEANAVKERGGVIIYIDASDDTRHDRILDRQRDGDVIDKALLVALDKQEGSADGVLNENLVDVKKIADVVIVNDGSLEDLYAKLDHYCDSL